MTPPPWSRAPQGAVRVEVPAGWIEVEPPEGSSRCLEARSPKGTCVALATISETDPAGSLSLWSDQVYQALAALPAAQVLDHASVTIGATTSRRLLTHHLARSGGCVLETWIIPIPGCPVVLTCTTSPIDYDALALTFATIARSISVDPPP